MINLKPVTRTAKELYRYRSLLEALIGRYLAVRYRGSALGYLWSLLNPLCLMAVYTLVFKYYIRFSEVDNYSVFMFCGLLPWIWITSSLNEATISIVSSGHLVTKSAFPAHILPTVALTTNLVHFLLALPVLTIFCLFAGIYPNLNWFYLPIVILINFVFLYGICLALSALNVFFRDVQHVIGNILSLLFFLCPIVYPSSQIPPEHQSTFLLNPISLLIVAYQKIVLEGAAPSFNQLFYVTVVAVIFTIIGIFVYDRYQESFSELL